MLNIIKVIANTDYTVTIYAEDNKTYTYNAAYIVKKHKILQDKDFFVRHCAVINNTVAWFLNKDDTIEQRCWNCIDIAQEEIEQKSTMR